MRTLFALLVSLATSLSTLGCSLVGVRSGYESAPYEVLETLADDVQVRRYAARLAIETEVEARDAESARSEAFRILAAYIFGENEARGEVAMTVPVESTLRPASTKVAMTVPVETETAGGRMRMRFFAPSNYTLETLPKPKDDRVRLLEVEGETVAVLQFSGLARQATISQRTRALRDALAGSDWTVQGDPTTLFYDPPWTLPFLRRNEVVLPVAVDIDRRVSEPMPSAGASRPGVEVKR